MSSKMPVQMAAAAAPSGGGQDHQKSIIEIYTDWANHYLEKLPASRRSVPKVRDLTSELSDGLVLADVIEAVTQTKVPGVNRKPKGSSQVMAQNIQASLSFLAAKGVAMADAPLARVRLSLGP